MGVDTTMFACFEGRLTKAQVKAFQKWHHEQFTDVPFFSTATAHRHEALALTLVRVQVETADADLDEAFSDFVAALARKSSKRATVVFDHDGEFDAADLEALLDRVDDASLFSDRLEPSDAWAELDLATGDVRPTLDEDDDDDGASVAPRPASRLLPSPREVDATVASLRNAEADVTSVEFEGDLVFTRGADLRLSRLLIRRSSIRRELGPFLRALRGFVREVSVESADDVQEARDELDLSVNVLGQKNPFFDD